MSVTNNIFTMSQKSSHL